MRALLFVLLSACAADELPKPLTEGERAERAKKWRAAFDKGYQEAKNRLADAELKAKSKGATKTEKTILVRARDQLQRMQTTPTDFGAGVFLPFTEKPATGTIGRLVQPTLVVADVEAKGPVVVEGTRVATNGRIVVIRYLLAEPPAGAKKGAKVNLGGLWHCAGEAERNGRKLPVLYPFELKPDEIPNPVK